MLRIPIDAARDRLADLVEQARRGEDVVIEGDGASVRLVVEIPQAHSGGDGDTVATSDAPEAGVPVFGRGRGLYVMRDDFDDPIPGFEPYM